MFRRACNRLCAAPFTPFTPLLGDLESPGALASPPGSVKPRGRPPKRPRPEATERRFPYPDGLDDDAGPIAEAVHLFADKRRDFATLHPKHAAALLRHLCDDCLATPALRAALNGAIDGEERQMKAARLATQDRRAVEKLMSDAPDATAAASLAGDLDATRDAADRAAAELARLKEFEPLRREACGDDRRWTRYWELRSDHPFNPDAPDATPSFVCKGPDASSDGEWSRPVDGPNAVLYALNMEGSREGPLSEGLEQHFGDWLTPVDEEPWAWIATRPQPSNAAEKARSVDPASRCASLHWPGVSPPPGDDCAPKTVARRVRALIATPAAASQRMMAAVRKANKEKYAPDLSFIDKLSSNAADAAAPWRCELHDLDAACGRAAAELEDGTRRLDAVAKGDFSPPEKPTNAHPSLDDLCASALAVEAKLYSLTSHGREVVLKAHAEPEKEEKVLRGAAAHSKFMRDEEEKHQRAVDQDPLQEQELYELAGACADGAGPFGKHRELWRIAVSKLRSSPPDQCAAAGASFVSLYLGLREQMARHLGPLEARVRSAHCHLLGDDEIECTAILVPSVPDGPVCWARIKGYPWWPARRHRATREDHAASLKKDGRALIVFIGEAVQYFMPEAQVDKFTGLEDDPRLPKEGKKIDKAIYEAIEFGRKELGITIAPPPPPPPDAPAVAESDGAPSPT